MKASKEFYEHYLYKCKQYSIEPKSYDEWNDLINPPNKVCNPKDVTITYNGIDLNGHTKGSMIIVGKLS